MEDRVVMRNLICFPLLLAEIALALQAGAQAAPQRQNAGDDWGRVVRIVPGTPISVLVGRHWRHCNFDRADAETLQCWIDPPSGYLTAATMAASAPVFQREDVGKVRLDKKRDGTLMGAAIGGGLGVLPGAIGGGNGYSTQGGREVVGGVFGAIFGGVIGHYLPTRHAVVIYARATRAPAGSSAQSQR